MLDIMSDDASSENGSANTIDAARSLWESAVTVDASPSMTIKAAQNPSQPSTSVKAQPRPRGLSKAGELQSDSTGIDFELGQLLGQGGMGVVYAARQHALDREIAVKMLNTCSSKNQGSIDKFLSEAVITGKLDHPNIVPVYDVGGTADGTVFYAMKEVSGSAWDDSIKEMSLDENLRILMSVCDAVAFAHDRGIVHRDLKPENVMLGDYGEVLLMDWGLALHLGGEQGDVPDQESGLAGTPAYMAPEMACCNVDKLGPATDIYLLGGILYEIVTGLKPHGGGNVFATISSAMENYIQPSDSQGELIDIATTAMATEPGDRYASVKDFQAAVRAYLEHAESLTIAAACAARLAKLGSTDDQSLYRESNEIVAGYQQALQLWAGNRTAADGLCRTRTAFVRSALERGDLALAGSQLSALESECDQYACRDQVEPPLEKLRAEVKRALARAAARERLVRVSTTVAIIGALAAIGITGAAYLMTRQQRNRAMSARQAEMQQRRQAQDALGIAEEANYYNLIALADRSIAQAEVEHAEKLLRSAPPRLRAWEWGALAYLCRRDLLTVRGDFAPVCCAAFAPDGKLMVTGGLDDKVSLWDTSTGKPLSSLLASGANGVLAVAFHAGNPKHTLVLTRDGNLRTWDPQAAEELSLVRLSEYRRDLVAVSISPGGERVAGIARDGHAFLWDSATAALLSKRLLQGTHDGVNCMAVSADSLLIATGSNDGVARIYETESGVLRSILTPHTRFPPLLAVAFSPDSRYLAVGTSSRLAGIWDRRGDKVVLMTGRHAANVRAVAFAPDGLRFMTGGDDSTIRVWDARNQREFLTLTAHRKPVTCVAFSPDGRYAATGGGDETVRIWQVDDWHQVHVLSGHAGTVSGVSYDAESSRVLTAGYDRTVRVWDAALGEQLVVIEKHDGPVTSASFSPDGTRIVTSDLESARIWDSSTGRRLARLKGEPGSFRIALFSPDGKRLLTAGNTMTVWDAGTGRKLVSFPALSNAVSCAAFSPDGTRVITGDRSTARIWNATGGTELLALEGHASAVSCVVYSPDGKRVLTCDIDSARLWNARTGRELLLLSEHDGWVTSAAFSPDGKYLLTGGNDGTAKLRIALDWEKDIPSLQEWKRGLYATWLRMHQGQE